MHGIAPVATNAKHAGTDDHHDGHHSSTTGDVAHDQMMNDVPSDVVVGFPIAAPRALPRVRLPHGVTVEGHAALVTVDAPSVLYVTAGVLLGVTFLLLIAAVALWATTGYPDLIEYPLLVAVIAGVFSLLLAKHETSIDMSPLVPPAEREIRCATRRAITWCCGPWVQVATWADVRDVDTQCTCVHICRTTHYRVVAVCDGGARIPLFQGPSADAEQEAMKWREFFRHGAYN